jgi:hypothetical protein
MRQVDEGRGMPDAGKAVRLRASVSSIAGFERLLLATKQYAVVQAGQKRDPGPEPPGILANVGLEPQGLVP